MLSLDKDKLKSMICYTIVEPPSDCNQLRAYKYPFASSEVLSISTPAILDLFFQTEDDMPQYELIDLLFSYVNVPQTTDLNEILSGYFKKIVLNLISGKPREMADYLAINEKVIYNLFSHTNDRSISEVLSKILAIEDVNISNTLWFNKLRFNIFQGLLYRINGKSYSPYPSLQIALDHYTIELVSLSCCDLLEQSKDMVKICCSDEILKELFELSLNPNKNISAAGLRILVNLFQRDQVKDFLHTRLYNISVTDKYDDLLNSMIAQLISYKTIILSESEKVINQLGMEIEHFGSYRLKVIEYIQALVKLSLFPVIDQMFNLDYPKLLIDLFNRFPFNSGLHNLLYSIYQFITESECRSLLHVVIINKI